MPRRKSLLAILLSSASKKPRKGIMCGWSGSKTGAGGHKGTFTHVSTWKR
ncbi:MAG: hypothetical protein RR954_09705 [Christensenellaceae bacterium]